MRRVIVFGGLLAAAAPAAFAWHSELLSPGARRALETPWFGLS